MEQILFEGNDEDVKLGDDDGIVDNDGFCF